MAISYKKQYTSEAEYMYDLARSSELYRDTTYNFVTANNQSEDYAYALAGTKTKESDTFDLIEYDLLSGEDQYMYLLNEYYVDKTETAKDEETGETYNIYQRNREYLDYKIEEAIDRQTYESLNGFEKFLHTIGGVVGNAFNELFLGTIEGLVDVGAVIVGQKDWAATDFTGVQANRESLQRYARAYTYIDKSGFWKGVNDVATGITKMAPLLIPYAGQAIYFGAMAGNTAEEAIRANPDIDYGSLLLYTAGTTAVEFATEKISSFLFGTGKLVGGAKSANFLTRFGLDFLSEGFEEGVSEIAGSILYQQFVDPNAPIASFKDVMYASLIGGLIGGIATTGRIAGTRSKTILKDGTVVDTKVAKAQGLEGKKLSKTKSLYLQEQISDIKDAQETSELTKLQAKYSGESLQQIQESHAEEYKQAIQQDAELQEKMIESSLGLTKILEMAGVEGFTKAADLVNYTAEQKARLINNFVSTATGVSAENRAVEEKFKKLAGAESSFSVIDSLNTTQQTLKNKIKQLYGKNVYFGNLGEQDGVMRRHGLTLDENTIVLDVNLTQNMNLDYIMNTVVKEELVHTLQFDSGILDAKTLHDLMEQYKKLGGTSQQIELDAAYRTSSDLTKISETQAKTLAQTLLFDKFTVSRIFSTNRTLFNKIYNWTRNIKEGIENLKNRKTNSDKVKYRQLLKIMKRYRDSVAENIGNTEDAQQAISEMRLTDEQIQELYDTYLPDATNEHFTLLKAEYTIHTQQRMAAEKLLLKARNPIMSLTDTLDFKYIFDTNYWGTIDDGKGNKINFVEAINSRDPSKDFRRNLQEYMIEVTGFAINQKEGCLMEVLDYNTVTTNDFDQTMAELQTNPDALSKYTRLSDIFNEEFNRKFVTIDGVNDLEDVDLRFVTRDTDENLQAKYEGINPQTQKPTITVYLKAGQQWGIKQIDNLKHKLFHEVTHALADIQGLPNGTSYNYVRTALQELDRQQINRLGKLLLTDEFYNENKNNLNILMDNIAYGIYRITDGEYAAEAYAQSLTRKGDMKVNLKAGATMNRSGFRTDGLFIEGYGRFKGISLYASTVVQAKQNYKLSALRCAVEVVAFSKRSDLLKDFAEQGITDFEKAGFSDEFVLKLENETLTENDLWNMINTDNVGSEEASNKLIQWLAPDNKSMKTKKDVDKAKTLGIAYAVVYNQLRLKNDPEYNQKQRHSYEQLETFFSKNPKYYNQVITQSEKIAKLLDRPENSAINSWLIKKDYGYSANATKKLMDTLKGSYGINASKAVVSESSSVQGRLGTEDVSVFDTIADTAATPEEAVIQQEEGVEEVKETSLENYISTLQKAMSAVGDSEELFKIRKKIENDKSLLIRTYGEDGYKQILSEAPTSKATYTKKINRLKKQIQDTRPLSVRDVSILSIDVDGFKKPSDYERHINRLENLLTPKTQTVVKEQSVQKIDYTKKATQEEINSEILNPDGSKKIFFKGADVEGITEFDNTKGKKQRTVKNAAWFTDSREIASTYVNPNVSESTIYSVELSIKNPLILDAENRTFNDAYGKEMTDTIVQQAFEKGYDSVIFKNVVDTGANDPVLKPSTVIAVKGNDNLSIVGEDKLFIKNGVEKDYARKNNNDFKPVSETVIADKLKKPSDISQSILNNFKRTIEEMGVSEAQFFDFADKAYVEVGYKMIEENAELFVGVNNENYDEIRNEIKSNKSFYSDQALLIFDLYTLEMKGKFSQEIQNKIEAYNRRELTKSAQKLALQSRRVAERKPVTNVLNQFAKEGYKATVSDEQIQEYDKKLKDKDAYIKELSDRIDELEKQIKATENELEKQSLLREAREVSNHKLVIENGTNEDIADWIVTHAETLEQATNIQTDILQKALDAAELAEAENKNVGYFFYNKDGTPKPFQKTRELVMKVLKKAKSFRMWAMLSSPVTWVRNWIGNQGMKSLDGATNTVERFISKRIAFDETQMKYNETRAGKDVYNHIAKTNENFIQSLIRGEGRKYDETGEQAADIKRQLRAKEYESANAFQKACLKAQDLTDWGLSTGFLGDEPVVFDSICKNMGNLVASNTDFLLKGIQNELEGLNKLSVLSEEKQNRKKLLEKAVDSKNANDIFDALSKEETTRLFDQAKQMSFQQYFKNQNNLNKWLANFGAKHPIMGEIASWIMPFPKVAVNILSMAYRFSPLGFVRGVMLWSQARQVTAKDYKGRSTGFEQAEMVRSFSEATVGTFMFVAGAIAAALGWVDIDEDDYLGPCLHFGDVRISLSNLAPSMTVFSTASAMIWAGKNNKSAVTQALNVLYDNTLLGNVENIFRYSSPEKYFENLSISYISQYIPAVLKLINKSILKSPQKDKSSSNYFVKLGKTLGSYIPGVSSLVPNKIDPYTGKKEYASGSENWLLNFIAGISPLDVQYDTRTEFEKMAEKYKAETTGLSGRFTINTKDYTVTNKQKENLSKFRADYLQDEFEKITNGKQKVTVEDENGKRITTTWNNLTDSQKSKVLKNLYSKSTEVSKIKHWIHNLNNQYVVTDRDLYNTYKKLFGSTQGLVYKQSWSKSKFIER